MGRPAVFVEIKIIIEAQALDRVAMVGNVSYRIDTEVSASRMGHTCVILLQ